MNKKTGGIISLIGALFGIFAVGITGCVGLFESVSTELMGNKQNTLLWMSLVGIIGTITLIILSVKLMNTNNKNISIGVIITSVITGIGGGTLLLVFMILCLVGGVIGYIDLKNK